MSMSYEILELNEQQKFISFKVYRGRDVHICNVANFAPLTWEHDRHITEAVEQFITHHYPDDGVTAVPPGLRGQRNVG